MKASLANFARETLVKVKSRKAKRNEVSKLKIEYKK
jgi:hypothetical protein